MAIVPKVREPSAQARGGPLPVSAPREAFGTMGESLSRLGRTVGEVADNLAVQAERQAALDNKIAVDQATVDLAQAYGQMDEDFRNNNKGIAASENLKGLYTNMEATRGQIGSTLRSPAAQQAYASASRIATLQFTQRAASFASQEKKSYQTEQVKGQIKLLQQGQNAENFDEVNGAILQRYALLATPQMLGMSEDEYKALAAQEIGTNAYNVTVGLAGTDPLKAQAFFDKHEASMNAQQRAQAAQYIKSRAEPLAVAGLVDSVIAGAAQEAVTGTAAPTAYREAIAGIESGGNYTAKGPSTKSGDRAYGKYQIMGANVRAWTKEVLGKEMSPQEFLKSPAAQDKVFDAKFGQYVAKYGPEGAASMWFSGKPTPSGRRDALGTTDTDYVRKFRTGLGREQLVATQGVGGSQVDLLESQVPQMLATLRADPMFIGRPDLLDAAEARLMSNISRFRTANNIASGEAIGRLQLAALEGGIQDLATLQGAYPGALKDYNQLSDAGKRQVQVGLLQEANRWTPTRGARANELIGMAGDSPAEFLKVDLSGEDITRSDRESLLKKQVAIRNKDKTEAAKAANFNKMMGSPWVQAQVKDLGLGKATPGYWYFSGAMEAKFDQWAANNPGKQPTDKDVAAMVGAVSKQAWEWKSGKVGGALVRRQTAEGKDALVFEPTEETAKSAETYLRAKGLPVNPQAISYYLTLVRDLRQAANRRGVQVSPDQFDAFIMENLGG